MILPCVPFGQTSWACHGRSGCAQWWGALLWTTGALLPCLIGHSPCQAQLVQDFRALRQAAQDMKLFEASPTFFALVLGHILAMEVLAWLIIYLLGPGWVPSALTALILAISQVILALSCSPLNCPMDAGPGT